MRLLHLAIVAVLPATLAAQRGGAVRYDVAFPNAVHHEAEITAEFSGVAAGTLDVRMSRSSPGRYALHEFAKNVYGLRAVDGSGKALRVTHPSPSQWLVTSSGGTVRVSYTLFGDRIDGTYVGISERHAHLNMPAVFLWARGFEARPITVTFHPRPGWQVATQLATTGDSLTFTAPHLQLFMDSPTMLGPLTWRAWSVAGAGRNAEYRIAMHQLGPDSLVDAFTRGAQQIVREAEGVWGEAPPFDFGRYTFLAAYLPWASGDGMEHRNSTSLTSSGTLANNLSDLLGTVSHEYFHAWNVERLRPASLEPFNLSEANPSRELWLAEGFTSYYGPLIMVRAGLTTLPAFLQDIGSNADAVVNAPGRRWFSAAEMSEQAPFVDAATSVDPQNKENTFLSYYTWGAGIGLALDLALRARSDTLSLDTFMRAMWAAHGRTQVNFAPAKPYTLDDARRVLGRVAGDTAWANNFFARYVTGRDAPDFAPLLAPAGVIVRRTRAGRGWMGDTRWRVQGSQIVAASAVRQGSPLYTAGVELGDRLLQIAGVPVSRIPQIDSIVAAHQPGDRVPLVFQGRSGVQQVVLTLAEDPHIEFVAGEAAGQPLTAEQRAFRQRWLSSARKN